MAGKKRRGTGTVGVGDYRHDSATRKNNPPAKIAAEGVVPQVPKAVYAYSPRLDPKLRFDDTGKADRLPELLEEAKRRKLTDDEARLLAEALRSTEPWLEWASKREQRRLEVDPVALHIHERVSTQAILKAASRADVQRDLFADPQQAYHEAVQFYLHDIDWTNRLILGDSLQVMSSLSRREDLAGKVQMIYLDPPYGIRFASNFQPLVKNRTVGERQEDLTREPEMVRAYRDTWHLGVHSYLSYLRDRLFAAKELLTDSGSVFVQISDENLHRVRCVMDEVFGAACHVVTILVKKKGSQKSNFIDPVNDYLLWYSKSPRGENGGTGIKFRPLYEKRELDADTLDEFNKVELADGRVRLLKDLNSPDGESLDYRLRPERLFKDYPGARLFRPWPITNGGFRANQVQDIDLGGKSYSPPKGRCWSHTSQTDDGSPSGMDRVKWAKRLVPGDTALDFKRYLDDFPYKLTSNWWDGLGGASKPVYVVQTNEEIIKRCMLMTTDPGDLVLDPTCGSGTTAVVAEQWGRRWITIDTSRVAIALARARLVAASFPYYLLADSTEGRRKEAELSGVMDGLDDPSENDIRKGFVYDRALRITSSVFANNPEIRDGMAAGEIDASVRRHADPIPLHDRPLASSKLVRVSGPFTVEAVQPPEIDLGGASGDGGEFAGAPEALESTFGGDDAEVQSKNADAYLDDMLRLLRTDGVRFPDNRQMAFSRLDVLDGTASGLHAEGRWAAEGADDDVEGRATVAVAFGPQYGPVTARQVEELIRAANRRGYDDLVVAGFSFDGAAQAAIEEAQHPNLRIHMAHIRPDVNPGMDGLLKDQPGGQLFSVFGQPRTTIEGPDKAGEYTATMEGVDVYDPVANTVRSTGASKVAAWFLDSDYDGRTFCITQAFFPDRSAWTKLAKALKGVIDEAAFDAFSGTTSLPFSAGKHRTVAIKVIDPRGNEVMRVHRLEG